MNQKVLLFFLLKAFGVFFIFIMLPLIINYFSKKKGKNLFGNYIKRFFTLGSNEKKESIFLFFSLLSFYLIGILYLKIFSGVNFLLLFSGIISIFFMLGIFYQSIYQKYFKENKNFINGNYTLIFIFLLLDITGLIVSYKTGYMDIITHFKVLFGGTNIPLTDSITIAFSVSVFEEIIFRLLSYIIFFTIGFIFIGLYYTIIYILSAFGGKLRKFYISESKKEKERKEKKKHIKAINIITVVLMTLSFAIPHFGNQLTPIQLLLLFIDSFLLCFIFVKNTKIIYTIILHFLHNLFLFLMVLILI